MNDNIGKKIEGSIYVFTNDCKNEQSAEFEVPVALVRARGLGHTEARGNTRLRRGLPISWMSILAGSTKGQPQRT